MSQVYRWCRAGCAGLAVLCVLALSACATPQAAALRQTPGDLPVRQQLTVPFVAQEGYYCGPAAVDMALKHHGIKVDYAQLVKGLVIPDREGSLQLEMLSATRRHGLLAYPLKPALRDVLQETQAGRPVIVLVNLAYWWWPRWHYVVVTGYDLPAAKVYVHSGDRADQAWSLYTFERLWSRAGYWGFVPLSPGELPVNPDEKIYMRAALDLERGSGVAVAEPAYRKAVEAWPQNLTALIASGNARYAAGDRSQAEQLFREAVAAHPESAVAANNLAQVLLEHGRADEALHWAQKAVELGGGAAARATLQDIQRQAQATH